MFTKPWLYPIALLGLVCCGSGTDGHERNTLAGQRTVPGSARGLPTSEASSSVIATAGAKAVGDVLPPESPDIEKSAPSESAPADPSPPPASHQDRENRLRQVLLNPKRWRSIAVAREIWGYVCVFYSVPSSPDCRRGNVRMIARYRFQGKPTNRCPIEAALYFAPSRTPDRPKPDLAGIISFQSDGSEFRYSELDDYIVETKGCAPLPEASSEDVRLWTKELASELGVRFPP